MNPIRPLCWILSISLAAPASVFAAGPSGLSLSQEVTGGASGSEFVSGNYPGAILMPVNLWGSVGKPGIHHIPTRTDLVTLLSLAGGPGADAELDSITIKRRTGGNEEIIDVDAEKILRTANVRGPVLEANDIIVIPRSKPTINPNTVTTVGFFGGILSVVLAGFALSTALKK